jgi:cobalt-zinc-cadmium efflux system protein
MLVVAGLGLLLNAGIMYGLRSSNRDLNIRAAYLHMMGDAVGSVGIIVGAVAIRLTGWQWVDPALSALIGILIIWTAWDVIRDSLNILLEGLPRGMNLQRVIADVQQVEGVIDVHDVHIWSLGPEVHALSCHVLIDDMPPSESDAILKRVNRVLCDGFHIHHTTIQFEHVRCALAENGCSMPAEMHRHER